MGKPHKGKLAPFACFNCRRSFKRKLEPGVLERPCPSCGGAAHWLMEKFKPPKSDDIKQWQKVQFLYEHGFWFQSVPNTSYPETLQEAKEFVKQHAAWAWTREGDQVIQHFPHRFVVGIASRLGPSS